MLHSPFMCGRPLVVENNNKIVQVFFSEVRRHFSDWVAEMGTHPHHAMLCMVSDRECSLWKGLPF